MDWPDRVGQHYEVDMVALINASGDAVAFKAAAESCCQNRKLYPRYS